MLTIGEIERDPHKWVAALQQVEKEMLAKGWNKHSKKFDSVKMKKAMKLFQGLM